jgi:hypothetical protein
MIITCALYLETHQDHQSVLHFKLIRISVEALLKKLLSTLGGSKTSLNLQLPENIYKILFNNKELISIKTPSNLEIGDLFIYDGNRYTVTRKGLSVDRETEEYHINSKIKLVVILEVTIDTIT